MRLLLDTCTFLWLSAEPGALSPAARDALEDPDNELLVHQVSVLEIVVKHAAGRLPLATPPAAFVRESLARHGLLYAALDDETVFNLGKLPALHRDPFDRLLVSHALLNGLALVTPDPAVHRYPVRALW
jgi:PIN domain nuclease of toxin-antitoxin system